MPRLRATRCSRESIRILPSPLRIETTLLEPNLDHYARSQSLRPVVHTRSLRHHDRGFAQLRLMLPDAGCVAAAHLVDPVRVERGVWP
jgi:hypothetical protein